MDMKDEYICLPRNITKLQRINRDYNAAGLPGCVGSMDVVHVKWSNCPTSDYNCLKRKEGYPTLAFQCITDLIAGFGQSMDHSLEVTMTGTLSSKMILFVPSD